MRIAFVGPFGLRPKMTMARRALPLARALVARGHTVRVILPPWDCPELSGTTWTDAGVEIVNVRLSRAGPVRTVLLCFGMVRCVLAYHPDVLHCFKPKGYAGIVAALFWLLRRARLWDGRLVVDADDWEGSGGWNDLGRYSRLERRLFDLQERWGLCHCDGVTAASKWLMERVRAMCGGSSAAVLYLPNGVRCDSEDAWRSMDGEHRARGHEGLSRRQTALLYTRFVEHRPSDVIAIWQGIVRKVPEARLVVAGQGFGDEVGQLRCLAEEAGLTRSMDAVGWVEADRLAPLFAGADIALMPVRDTLISRAKSPARLLDLMAAGLPVVAHGVGEWVELLDHGSCGVLVPPSDDDAFIDEALRLLADAGLRRELGDAARERALSEYDWDRLAAGAEEAYLAVGAGDFQVKGSSWGGGAAKR